ncbi:hypothetical protein DACRYDRAFT_23292 [Dacryopinax primogenitus]|uniref:Uncharacterized protein n=1 Tax=Dacryopinax primogenitus (strain DJM 731) TaxID=1858805 RepID=M5G3E5_DACPD|nr:uncharacterized protein DACRYDRAFT_23292 [Dacryopinax primogenitus]EJU00397.1 hypothetical protein DACRYDRAFT_23292 [Dacryopinax primogenitus]
MNKRSLDLGAINQIKRAHLCSPLANTGRGRMVDVIPRMGVQPRTRQAGSGLRGPRSNLADQLPVDI